MKRTFIYFFFSTFALCTCWLNVPFSYAVEPIIITAEQEKYQLGSHLEYLEDPMGELTIDDAKSTDYASQFVLSEKGIPTIGFTDSAYWVRVRLRNQSNTQNDWRLVVNEPYLDFVDIYLPNTDGEYFVKLAGNQRPVDVREVKHRKSVFKVAIPSNSSQTLYIRIQSKGLVLFDLTLWTAEAFQVNNSRTELFLGFFMGVMCIMAVYNLFLFLVLADRAYLHYVLFLFCLILHFATMEFGLSYHYLWPNWTRLNSMVMFFFPSLSMFFALNFAMVFLQTKIYTPTLHLWLMGLRLPFLLLAILWMLVQSNLIILGTAFLAVPTIIIIVLAGILAWRKGYQPARYYILAWSMLWLNSLVFILHTVRLINVPNHLQFAPFTITGMMLFLSLALADRINVFKQQTEQAKKEADTINLKLEQHQKSLTRSEKKYRTLFEDSNDMIFITTLDNRIEDVSPSCETVLGYTRSEYLKLNAHDAYAEPADSEHLLKIILQDRTVKDYGVKLRHKNGQEVDALITATLRYGDDGTVLGFQGIVRDITAHKHAEAERLRAVELQSEKELAEAANKAKSMFLANMSHELRTPLNAILGFSDFMTRDPNLTSEQQQNLETIGRSGEHLLALINDVLEFSKIEAGNVELRLENFDLHRMLLSLEEMFRIRAEQKKLSLKLIIGADVPRLIRADQNKIRQVLINLLGNAVKYVQKGEISLRVGIGYKQEGNAGYTQNDQIQPPDIKRQIPLRFEVEDTGKGIAPDDLNAIFQIFYQTTDGAHYSHGTGLGLPISQEFVRMLGGELKVSSRVGMGSNFQFELLVEQIKDTDIVVHKPIQRVIGLEPDQQDFRILVVEDNDTSRELLIKLLRLVGFDSREAANGSEAVTIFEQWRPHLIWMDIRMPVMDGYEATRSIKAKQEGDETVIIALTASAFEEDRKKVLEHGCNDFVRKPFKESEIFEKMHRFLGVRYLYENITPKISMGKNTEQVKLTPELLMELPAELRLELKNAVESIDFEEAIDIIEKIKVSNEAVADALTHLVSQYRFDRLQELFV